ncbi:hypothetical protein [Streptomyces sp. CoH17]|uniref:hypothetical protein n=1 Tax=Streptomyces sp. CoH17 TaxID=2992806 RepID=UPI0022713D79|nr:hypothetical protein [Streptomyces sp. CoH17]
MASPTRSACSANYEPSRAFETRHGTVWRVEWHGAWYLADWTTQNGALRETGIKELIQFAVARLHRPRSGEPESGSA